VNIELVTVVVHDYDKAIEFFVGTLGFDLVEDVPAVTKSGGSSFDHAVQRPVSCLHRLTVTGS
jgi:catechol 2,3-dioxygenase-like lactoylglutathione lyase family enzyme